MDHTRIHLKTALYGKYPTIKIAAQEMGIQYSRLVCFISGFIDPTKPELDQLEKHLGLSAKEMGIYEIDPVLRKFRSELYTQYRGVYNAAKVMSMNYSRLAGIANGKLKPTEEEYNTIKCHLLKPLGPLGL